MSDITDEARGAEDLRAALEAKYDGQWRVWSSDAGAWYATRRRITLSEQAISDVGCAQTVAGDDLGELADQLAEQELHDACAIAALGSLS